jgi:arabinan endo-1,5-alpha-L-arabinosidase
MLPLVILLACGAWAHAQEGAVRGVHDPCIINAGGTYYLFSTGPGIPIRRSSDLFHWQRADRVFDVNPAWFAQEVPGARWIWAPDIVWFGGEYHLYYSVSTFGSNRSCIALATNRTLDPASPNYKWIDRGPVLRSSTRDDYNAIDPNVVFDLEQKPWLVFGSYWSGIKLTRLDAGSGKLVDPDHLTPLASRPGIKAVEAPFLIRRHGFYYLFVSFDQCCRGVSSTYHIVVGRSPALTGPYLDRQGRSLLDGGGTTLVESGGRVRGPGHCAVLSEGGKDWLVHHFYDADREGVQTLQIRPLRWDDEGFPIAGEPICGPVTASR